MFPVEISGERLKLREFTSGDAAATLAWTGDVAAVQFVPLGPMDAPANEDYVATLLGEAAREPRNIYNLAIEELATGHVVGVVGLTIDSRRHRRGELGYLLRADRWGRGYATEAAALMVDFGFDDIALHRIWAVCDAENTASARVLRKLGMRYEGSLRHDMMIGEEWRDSELYAVLATDDSRLRTAAPPRYL